MVESNWSIDDDDDDDDEERDNNILYSHIRLTLLNIIFY